MKLTPWIVGRLKPVRVGVYQRESAYGVVYSYWNGRFWGMIKERNVLSEFERYAPSQWQDIPWRGVAK